MTKAIFPSSHWGSNIGNVFFYIGTQHLLSKAIPSLEIVPSDLPPQKAFGLTPTQRANDSDYGYRLGRADYLVLDGPMFDKNFGELFGPYLRRAKELNIKVLLMSTGGIEYTEGEVEHCRSVLKSYPPYMITTRDAQTYQNYRDMSERTYDGICSAWFAPEAYPGYEIPDEKPYVTACFDHAPEPVIRLGGLDKIAAGDFSGVNIDPVLHSQQTKVTRLLQRDFADSVDGVQIIRPCHQVLNRQNWRLFFKKNSFCSQTPWGYLNLYRNTRLTITDRLHASVATLAYGNPARLFIKSKRTHLLDRVGAQDVGKGVYKMDLDRLAEEKAAYQEWLRAALN